MIIKLINYTPLWVCSDAIRTCWASQDKSDTHLFMGNQYDMGDKDLALIERVGNKNKHASTLEHLNYNFHISGISRAVLQELSRHRMASLSVKSTRYTLKELKEEEPFLDFNSADFDRALKFIVPTFNIMVDKVSFNHLEDLRQLLRSGLSNDIVKYALPESYRTELAYSINARSLQNFLELRTNKAALWEIRILASELFKALPDDHKYIFKDFLYQEPKDGGNE